MLSTFDIYRLLKRLAIVILMLTLWSAQTIAFEVDPIRTLNSFGSYNGDQFLYGADIAVDSQGLPVVVYINTHTSPDSLMMSRCLDPMCENVSTKTLVNDVGNLQFGAFVSIAFKEDDTLGIMFSKEEEINGSLQKSIYYMECADSSCDTMTESLVEDRIMYELLLADISFDNNGKLNVLASFFSGPGYLILYRCNIENGVFQNRIVNNNDECEYIWLQEGTYSESFKLLFNSNHFPVIAWQHKPYIGGLENGEGYVAQCLDNNCSDQSVSSDLTSLSGSQVFDFAISNDIVVSAQGYYGGSYPQQAAFGYCVDNTCMMPITNSIVAPNEADSQTSLNVDSLPSGNFVISYTVRRFDAPGQDNRNHSMYAATCYSDSTCDEPVLIESDLGFLRHTGYFHSVSTDDGTVYLTYFDTLTNGDKELKIARLGNDTCTISPTNDSWIRSNRADKNFGGQPKLDIRPENKSGTNIRRSLIHFDLADNNCLETELPLQSGSVVSNAELRLTIENGPSTQRQLAVTRILQSWSEDTVTWNNQPSKDVIPTAISTTGTGTTISWDVTDDVIKFINGSLTNYGWMLTDVDEDTGVNGSGAKTRLTSKEETAMQPTLVIQYSK